MTKKLIKHIVDVAIENPRFMYQYKDELRYFVTDGHRVVRYNEELKTNPQLTVNAHDNLIRNVGEHLRKADNCTAYELPDKETIKAGINEVAGRAYSVKVAWGNDKFIINARYLLKAMEALNAKICYISEHNPGGTGIFLYENDDLQSDVYEMILPVIRSKYPNKTGFWTM